MPKQTKQGLKLEEFFDETTMSVHLREKVQPMAKKGSPGSWEFVSVRKTPCTSEEIEAIAEELMAAAREQPDSFVEIEREGSVLLQVGLFRTVILRPPLSDGWEITAVRPVKQLNLEDYSLSEKMKKRIADSAEGILIAGAPGQGKTTFAQALAKYYYDFGKIVKTVEAPRDLVLPDGITQLALSRGTPEEIHDILLLSRPDYSLFDEMRNSKDFELFADLRLAGVGMVGVIHGTEPLDAIQRFIGKIDLGVIPHVIDTVVFIKAGAVDRVLGIHMIVKVPAGMTEEDLARPVVVIDDFETGKPVAEIYSYGEETVVVPVHSQGEKKGAHVLAAKQMQRELQHYSEEVQVELVGEHKAVVRVHERDIAKLIGQGGKNIQRLEKELGVGIDVLPIGAKAPSLPEGRKEMPFQLGGTSKHFEFYLGKENSGRDVDIFVSNKHLATVAVGNQGVVRIKKSNPHGKTLTEAVKGREKIIFVEA